MTNPLLISRKENAGILRKICSEIGATPREISGDEWSLALFIKTDLKTICTSRTTSSMFQRSWKRAMI